MRLKNRSRVVITGAASGLGRVMALKLAERGARIALTDRDEDGLGPVSEAVAGAGGEPLVHALDVRDNDAWAALADKITESWGGVDLLINNAGVGDMGTLVESKYVHWDRQLDINVMGVVRGSKTFVPGMIKARRGHVINVASFAGVAQAPGMIAYNTAKAAVIAFSESLRAEVEPEGVGVSVLCPAFFKTNLTDSMMDTSQEMVHRINGWMERSGVTAEDVADAALNAVEKGRFMVLTHAQTRRYWWLKRFAPERYIKLMMAQATKRKNNAKRKDNH
ncbi:MAG: SDR family oxidoreductase [Myxococcota bacterium]